MPSSSKAKRDLSIYRLSWHCAVTAKSVVKLSSGLIIDCNPATETLTGKSRNNIIGHSITEFIPPDEWERALKEVSHLSEAPARYHDFHVIKPDGRRVPLIISTSGAVELERVGNVAVFELQDISIEQEQQVLLKYARTRSAKAESLVIVTLLQMIRSISLAMELRDSYTAGHQNRVAEIAVAIGNEMGWSAERLTGLRLGGQLHDIGKLSIPGEILTKPGKLSRIEKELLKEHCENGYNILKDIPSPWPIAAIALQHHEKLDGAGYPQGLTGEQIIPEAKVMAVADIFEAMRSHRPYRPALPIATVLAQLESEAGTKLDTDAVGICVSLCRQGRFDELFEN